MRKFAGLGMIAWMVLTTVAQAEAPAGWLDAGEGFYYQPPVVMLGEGDSNGQTLVTFQIQNQSGRPAGETAFRIVIYSNEGRILRELTRIAPGFAPGTSLIIDFAIGDIPPHTVGRVVVRTLQAEPPRTNPKQMPPFKSS